MTQKQLDEIRAEYRYRSDGDSLTVERLLTHIDADRRVIEEWLHPDDDEDLELAVKRIKQYGDEGYDQHGKLLDKYDDLRRRYAVLTPEVIDTLIQACRTASSVHIFGASQYREAVAALKSCRATPVGDEPERPWAKDEIERLRAVLQDVVRSMDCNHPPDDGGDQCDGEDCIRCSCAIALAGGTE